MTYAEAGGWGRAIVLECRRRGIPSVGLQHGFIYRHWLNYLHEPDEMAAGSRSILTIVAFPSPTLTLALRRLRGHAPDGGRTLSRPSRSRVTGSPRLDALAAECRSDCRRDDVARARARGAAPERQQLDCS